MNDHLVIFLVAEGSSLPSATNIMGHLSTRGEARYGTLGARSRSGGRAWNHSSGAKGASGGDAADPARVADAGERPPRSIKASSAPPHIPNIHSPNKPFLPEIAFSAGHQMVTNAKLNSSLGQLECDMLWRIITIISVCSDWRARKDSNL
jgi:hypothetical protein